MRDGLDGAELSSSLTVAEGQLTRAEPVNARPGKSGRGALESNKED